MEHAPSRSVLSAPRLAALAIAAAGFLAGVPALAQNGVLDQTSPIPMGGGSANFNADAAFLIWQQQIKTGIAGQLEGITITLTGPVGGTLDFRIRKGAAPSAQPVLFSTLVTKSMAGTQALFVDTTASLIPLAVGEIYVMEIQGTGSGLGLNGSYVAPPGQPLYSEPLYLGNNPHADGGWRLGVMTYMIDPCPVGGGCDDGDPCTTEDVCQGGVCAGTPIFCGAVDSCHADGVCNPQTGMCDEVVLPDGTSCDDADACTQTDTCVAGVCMGADSVVCPAPEACHDTGVCDPATGMCSTPSQPDGTACDDGDACTDKDTCQAGICAAGAPVVCEEPDSCHEASACDPATGRCDEIPKPDGEPCPEGTCNAGICEGGEGGSDAGGSAEEKGGCGCETASSSGRGAPLLALIGLAAVARRRRRSA